MAGTAYETRRAITTSARPRRRRSGAGGPGQELSIASAHLRADLPRRVEECLGGGRQIAVRVVGEHDRASRNRRVELPDDHFRIVLVHGEQRHDRDAESGRHQPLDRRVVARSEDDVRLEPITPQGGLEELLAGHRVLRDEPAVDEVVERHRLLAGQRGAGRTSRTYGSWSSSVVLNPSLMTSLSITNARSSSPASTKVSRPVSEESLRSISTFGHLAANTPRMAGRIRALTLSYAPMRSVALAPSEKAARSAFADWKRSMIGPACRRSSSPDSLRVTCRRPPRRSKRGSPTILSSVAICWLIADWV